MKPTPPALKWLAEKRARVAGKLQEQERALQDAQMRAEKLLEGAKRLQACTTMLRADLHALDATIRVYDVRIAASEIGPIRAWQGTYGNRGALKQFLIEVLQRQASGWLPTDHLAVLAMRQFSLSFDTEMLYRRWEKNSVSGALKALVAKGLVERPPELLGNERAKWRWREAVHPTLADLRAAALAASTTTPP